MDRIVFAFSLASLNVKVPESTHLKAQLSLLNFAIGKSSFLEEGVTFGEMVLFGYMAAVQIEHIHQFHQLIPPEK